MQRLKNSILLDEKINNIQLNGGIDTVQIRTTEPVIFDKDDFPYVHGTATTNSDQTYFHYVVNPNRYRGALIDSYAVYRQALKNCIDRFPHDNGDITINRIDFRFDNYDDDFRDFLKINVALLLLIGEQYKVTNEYLSRHLRSQQERNAVIKRAGFSIEYYDKEQERQSKKKKAVDSLDNGIKSRLELRSQKLKFNKPFDVGWTIQQEYTEVFYWVQRFNKAVTAANLEKVTAGLNDILVNAYSDWRERYGGGLRLSSFLSEYRNAIITKPQLIELYERLEIANAETKVRDLLKNHPIQVVDYENIDNYVWKIIDTAEDFLIS